MPDGIQDLPPPAVEWRRESDDERRQRLMRSGIVQPNGVSANESSSPDSLAPANARHSTLSNQIEQLRQVSANGLSSWLGLEAARWTAIKSPKKTSTVSDGSFGLNLELTRNSWRWRGFRLGFGPAVVFYHGGQFAELSSSPIRGQGYADFSSSELGAFASFVRIPEVPVSRLQSYTSLSVSYLPVRFISAQSQSLGRMINRSDTYSRTSLSIPGVGLRLAAGMEWGPVVKSEVFYGLQGAWPLQLRSRVGLQVSMGLIVQDSAAVAQ